MTFPLLVYYPHTQSLCVVTRPSQLRGHYVIVKESQ